MNSTTMLRLFAWPPSAPGWCSSPAGLVRLKMKCFGAGESAIEEKLMDVTRGGQSPEVGITASDATISLRILARAATRLEAEMQISPVEMTIRERLGSLVFGVEEEELQE